MKKLIKSTAAFALILSIAVGTVASAEAISDVAPEYWRGNDIDAQVTVKWGNVRDTALHTNKTSFDGSIDVTHGGTVELDQTLRFDNHDRIISRSNPVSWDSWIYGHWDGVRVNVSASKYAKIMVKTEQGEVSMSLQKLLDKERSTILSLGDGREIVLAAELVDVTPETMRVRAYWGGNSYHWSDPDDPYEIPVGDTGTVGPVYSDAMSIMPCPLDPRAGAYPEGEESDLMYRCYPRPGYDFEGSLTASRGTDIDFVSTYLFENYQGDYIKHASDSKIEWDSYILNHYDGIVFDVERDSQSPVMERGDTLTIRFDEFNWKRTVSLAALEQRGHMSFQIRHDGVVHTVVFEVVDDSVCNYGSSAGYPCAEPEDQLLEEPEQLLIEPASKSDQNQIQSISGKPIRSATAEEIAVYFSEEM